MAQNCNRSIVLVLLATVVGSTTACTAGANEKRRPNIVFLLSDDQTDVATGCYGNKQVKTPNMDRLAADGDCRRSRLTDGNGGIGLAEAKTDRYLQSLACDPSNWNFRHLKAIFQSNNSQSDLINTGTGLKAVGRREYWGESNISQSDPMLPFSGVDEVRLRSV